MVIGDRLKEPRESKDSRKARLKNRQACSGVTLPALKNGHTVPAVAILEKMARALEVPVYRLFHEGEAAVSIRTSKRTAGGQE